MSVSWSRRRHRARGRLPLGAPAERTGACTEAHAVGARLVLDLDHLGAQRREEPSRAGAGEHPAEIDDAHAGQREGLAVGPAWAGPSGQAAVGRQRRHLSRAPPTPRATARVCSPSLGGRCADTVQGASGLYQRAATYVYDVAALGVRHVGEASSLNVVRIAGILLGPPHGRPRQPVVLAVTPQIARRNPGWPRRDRPACRPWLPPLRPVGRACRDLHPFRAWRGPRWFPRSASEE